MEPKPRPKKRWTKAPRKTMVFPNNHVRPFGFRFPPCSFLLRKRWSFSEPHLPRSCRKKRPESPGPRMPALLQQPLSKTKEPFHSAWRSAPPASGHLISRPPVYAIDIGAQWVVTVIV